MKSVERIAHFQRLLNKYHFKKFENPNASYLLIDKDLLKSPITPISKKSVATALELIRYSDTNMFLAHNRLSLPILYKLMPN